jgi:hypothetical protein
LSAPTKINAGFAMIPTLATLQLASPGNDLYTDGGKLESVIAVAARDDDAFVQAVAAYG